MGFVDHIWLGVLAVFQGPELFGVLGVSVSVTVAMVLAGFLFGIIVGATPGLAGPVAMAIALPILISIFGYNQDALLPAMWMSGLWLVFSVRVLLRVIWLIWRQPCQSLWCKPLKRQRLPILV